MKKIIIFSLLIITLVSAFYASFAFEIEEKELISLGKCEDLLILNGRIFPVYYVVYDDNGKHYPAYCLDATAKGITDNYKYTISGEGKINDINVWRAIINGYPYKSLESLGVNSEQEAYYATKFAVYTMMYDRKIEDHAPVDSDAGRRTYNAFVQIVNNARNSTETIENDLSLNINSITNWQMDNINGEYVSKTYSVSCKVDIGSYSVNVNGTLPEGALITDINNNIKSNFDMNEQFKIIIPINNLVQNGSFTIFAKANLETKPIVYGKTEIPGTQSYAISGFSYEESSSQILDNYYKNITKIIIKKQEYGTDKILSGVKFNLLNNNKELVKENLITDENGIIILDNIIPDTYYLQETETLDGYNLYTDLIEVELGLNEEMQIVVNNTLKNSNEINKSIENVQVVETKEENFFNKENILEQENISNTQTVINEKNNFVEKNIENEQVSIQQRNEVKKLPKTGY